MTGPDRSRLLDLQRARLQQLRGQIEAIDRAAIAMTAGRARLAPHAFEGDGRACETRCDRCGIEAGKPDAWAIERANAYLARLGVPEALL